MKVTVTEEKTYEYDTEAVLDMFTKERAEFEGDDEDFLKDSFWELLSSQDTDHVTNGNLISLLEEYHDADWNVL